MIAFTAQYASGKITLEDDEIEDAQWFSRDCLPELPPSASIAYQLIDSVL